MLLFDLRDSSKSTYKPRIITLIVTSTVFIISLVINLTMDSSIYWSDQQIVPIIQRGPVIGSPPFIYFMNVISKYFDPKYYPKYIFVFYLLSYRKFQVAIWMFWYLILSYFLNVLKVSIHQARPFWIPSTQIIMESWLCQTDYGLPSGHSMLSIIFLEFILRFFARACNGCNKIIGVFYVLVFLLVLLIMFTRVMLGLHTFNQVLFGLSIGLYLLVIYYILLQKFIVRIFIKVSTHNKKSQVVILCFILLIIFEALSMILALVPTYSVNIYIDQINQTKGCNLHLSSSFNYNGISGSYFLFPAFAILFGLIAMKKPQNLAKKPVYEKLSLKFLGNIIIIIILAAIPVEFFTNDLWKQIEADTIGKSFISWACKSLGYFLAVFFILVITPLIGEKLGMQEYQSPYNIPQLALIQMLNMPDKPLEISISKDSAEDQVRRETQLIVPQQIISAL